MAKTLDEKLADFIVPLNMNGLQGRVLYIPSKTKKQEILMVYDRHSSLESWAGLAFYLNRYGSVTMPDLPGIGGMDSLYKVSRVPNVDNLADYLAAFVKWRYKRRRFTVVAVGFGFAVTTRMLQRYPDLLKKVDLLIGIGAYSHHDDFNIPIGSRIIGIAGAETLTLPPLAWTTKFLNSRQSSVRQAQTKKGISSGEELEREIKLRKANDMRTHMRTMVALLNLDNCSVRVDVPFWHLQTGQDRNLNSHNAEQHLKVIFEDYNSAETKASLEDLTKIGRGKRPGRIVPASLHKALNKH